MWGPIICGPSPFLHWGPRPEPRKGIAEDDSVLGISEVPLEERAKTVWEQFGKKSKISMSIEKETMDSITTKDKGKAAITIIQYSAPDKAMLFSFYNHPQPL